MAEFSEPKVPHLGMIQRAVDRMAGVSARTKPLGLVTIGALGSVAEATTSWVLAQERRHRDLDERVRTSDGPTDFTMTPDADIRARHGLRETMLARSTLPLYGTRAPLAALFSTPRVAGPA